MRLKRSARGPKQHAQSGVWLRRSVIGVAVAVAVTATAGACASGHNRKGDDDQPIVVHLTNDLAPPSDVTVYAVTQDGIRRLIGDVPPNKDRALKVPSDVPRGSTFRLVAERTAFSRPIVSQPITATSDGLIIDWSLQTNAIWFPDAAS
ncbi:MAG: hypothetical protein M3Y30_14590 [Gemmatimonadota bacterium]|nr:hypothetical protein [Gemmatimonadota bacterium]